MTRPSPEVARLQAELVAQLDAICAAGALARAAVMLAAERAGRPAAKVLAFARRKKHVPQLCPDPTCPNRAAPAFGMLCASHKDTPPATVRAWRFARRAAKGR